MFTDLKSYIEERLTEFDLIENKRLPLLQQMIDYLNQKRGNAELLFVCIHNSRRSFFGQIWGQTAAHYFGFKNVKCYSGGTEVTQIHPNTVSTLSTVGFEIDKRSADANPFHQITFSDNHEGCGCFSKMYDAPENPKTNFAAIMTCSPAETECPFIPGADFRIALTYEDPKVSDGTPKQEETYLERCADVARELLYIFSKVKTT